jgi:hypothetical protein
MRQDRTGNGQSTTALSSTERNPDHPVIHRRIRLDSKTTIFKLLANAIDLDTLHIEGDSIVERDSADFPERFHHFVRVIIPKSEEVEILGRTQRIIEPFCQKHRCVYRKPSSLLKNLKMASFRILAGGCWAARWSWM